MTDKVFSVTIEVKVVVKARSREEAALKALETRNIHQRLDSLKVTNVFCPADGR